MSRIFVFYLVLVPIFRAFFFFNDTATTEIYTLSLHDALPISTDANVDQILAQLRVSQAQSQLPPDVNNYGVTVQKSTTAPLMLVDLYSPQSAYDGVFLANYGYINLVDQLTRVPGISTVQGFGAGQYAMRLWVKPDQLAKLGITVPD